MLAFGFSLSIIPKQSLKYANQQAKGKNNQRNHQNTVQQIKETISKNVPSKKKQETIKKQHVLTNKTAKKHVFLHQKTATAVFLGAKSGSQADEASHVHRVAMPVQNYAREVLFPFFFGKDRFCDDF